MILRPTQLREALTTSIPSLMQNPDRLTMFIENGRVVSTLADSLSFEYQYALKLAITDYADDPDLIIVPTLLWLRENQPDMMASKEQRFTDFTFSIDALSGSLCSISMVLQLTERKATLISLQPPEQQETIVRTLTQKSEPFVKLLQENVYREVILCQRVNEAAKANMVACAIGDDLDQLGANNGVARLTLTRSPFRQRPPQWKATTISVCV